MLDGRALSVLEFMSPCKGCKPCRLQSTLPPAVSSPLEGVSCEDFAAVGHHDVGIGIVGALSFVALEPSCPPALLRRLPRLHRTLARRGHAVPPRCPPDATRTVYKWRAPYPSPRTRNSEAMQELVKATAEYAYCSSRSPSTSASAATESSAPCISSRSGASAPTRSKQLSIAVVRFQPPRSARAEPTAKSKR